MRKLFFASIVGILGFFLPSAVPAVAETQLAYNPSMAFLYDPKGLMVCGDSADPDRGYQAAEATVVDPDGVGKQYVADDTCKIQPDSVLAVADGNWSMVTSPSGKKFIITHSTVVDVFAYVVIPYSWFQ